MPVASGNTVVALEDVPLVIGPSDFLFKRCGGRQPAVGDDQYGLNLNGGTLTHTGGTVTVTNGMTVTAAELTDLTFTSASTARPTAASVTRSTTAAAVSPAGR